MELIKKELYRSGGADYDMVRVTLHMSILEFYSILNPIIKKKEKEINAQKVRESIDSVLPDEWINGNELPKRRGTYIIQDQHGNVGTAPFNVDHGSDGYWNIMYLKIKYWQELPKPHKS